MGDWAPWKRKQNGHGADDPYLTVPDYGGGFHPQPAKPPRRIPWHWVMLGASSMALLLVATLVVVKLTGDGDDSWRLAGEEFAADPVARSDGRDQELRSVASVGALTVAVGGEQSTLGYRAVFLVSRDGGRTFTAARVRTPSGEPAPLDDVPSFVAGSPSGWTALGRSVAGGTVVWTSRDGAAWTRQPDQAGRPFAAQDRVRALARYAQGFIATGGTTAKGDHSDTAPVVWLSQDGRSWRRVTGWQLHPPAKGTLEFTEIAAVSGVIVIRGVSSEGNGEVVWRSTDAAATWQEFVPPRPKDADGLRVAATADALHVVHRVKDGARLYSSTDGAEWKEGPALEAPGLTDLRALTGEGGTLTAAVVTDRQLDLLATRDGAAWTPAGALALLDGREVTGLAAPGGGAVVTGRDTGGDDANALLAVRDAAGKEIPPRVSGLVVPDKAVTGLAQRDGTVMAVGSTNGDASVWLSSDGRSWRRAKGGTLARPGTQRLHGVAAGDAGWLAVGTDTAATGTRPMVLTSRDGTDWVQADQDEVFAAEEDTPVTAHAVVSGPGGYVVVGDSGDSAITWYSADLKTWERGAGAGGDNLEGSPANRRWMRSVAAGPFGFVAAGGVTDPEAYGGVFVRRPTVWASPDGRKWILNRLPLPNGVNEGWLTHIAARGDLLVAAGTAVVADGARTWSLLYVSSDGGRTWQAAELPAGSGQSITVTAMTVTSRGVLVAGTAGRPRDVTLWSTRDGRTWRRSVPSGVGANGPGDQLLTAVTVSAGSLIGVGASAAGGEDQPTLLVRPDKDLTKGHNSDHFRTVVTG
ncbi:hypothetical protein GCM10009550_61750 [Actinocorallia libanotica]|uniref:DUF6242 domain-containing protein n=1 Tax=Actinocorallia libanotica TaxID=46162 RepID=A0ABN1RUM0_9ACTN